MSCQWREDEGLRYLHLDYRAVSPSDPEESPEDLLEGYLGLLAQSVAMIKAEPPGALLLIEVADVSMPSAFLAAVKRANHDVFGPMQTRKVYLGADGIRRRAINGLTLVAPSVQSQVYATRAVALTALRLRAAHPRPGR